MNASQLLADLTQRGVRLEASGDRLRFTPRSAVTADLAQRMKAHKAELLVLVSRSTRSGKGIVRVAPSSTIMPWIRWLRFPDQCDRCESIAYQDYPIHDGQSMRRDCTQCGRFIRFVLWYGQPSIN